MPDNAGKRRRGILLIAIAAVAGITYATIWYLNEGPPAQEERERVASGIAQAYRGFDLKAAAEQQLQSTVGRGPKPTLPDIPGLVAVTYRFTPERGAVGYRPAASMSDPCYAVTITPPNVDVREIDCRSVDNIGW